MLLCMKGWGSRERKHLTSSLTSVSEDFLRIYNPGRGWACDKTDFLPVTEVRERDTSCPGSPGGDNTHMTHDTPPLPRPHISPRAPWRRPGIPRSSSWPQPQHRPGQPAEPVLGSGLLTLPAPPLLCAVFSALSSLALVPGRV